MKKKAESKQVNSIKEIPMSPPIKENYHKHLTYHKLIHISSAHTFDACQHCSWTYKINVFIVFLYIDNVFHTRTFNHNYRKHLEEWKKKVEIKQLIESRKCQWYHNIIKRIKTIRNIYLIDCRTSGYLFFRGDLRGDD